MQACQPRQGGATSLIQLDIASHPAAEARPNERIPAGLEFWSVDVHITQLEVVFLNRFLQVRSHTWSCYCQGRMPISVLKPSCVGDLPADCQNVSIAVVFGNEWWAQNVKVACALPQELLGYIAVTLALRPEAKSQAPPASMQQAGRAVASMEAQALKSRCSPRASDPTF